MSFIESNFFDHCGMAYSQTVLFTISKVIKDKENNLPSLCSGLWSQSSELLTLYKGGHEALWVHRRELLLLFKHFCDKLQVVLPSDIINIDVELKFCDALPSNSNCDR